MRECCALHVPRVSRSHVRVRVCVCEGETAIDVTAVFLVAQVNKEEMSKGRKKENKKKCRVRLQDRRALCFDLSSWNTGFLVFLSTTINESGGVVSLGRERGRRLRKTADEGRTSRDLRINGIDGSS